MKNVKYKYPVDQPSVSCVNDTNCFSFYKTQMLNDITQYLFLSLLGTCRIRWVVLWSPSFCVLFVCLFVCVCICVFLFGLEVQILCNMGGHVSSTSATNFRWKIFQALLSLKFASQFTQFFTWPNNTLIMNLGTFSPSQATFPPYSLQDQVKICFSDQCLS
jgi:hypothetical protein